MIITAQEFLDAGLPVAYDIPVNEIDFAIRTVEQYMLRPIFHDNLWSEIVNNPDDYGDTINGNDTMLGLKDAEYHLVFAYLLWDRVRLTRFGDHVKQSDESTTPSRDDIMTQAKVHWEIGTSAAYECAKYNHVKHVRRVNDLIFGELYY